MRSVPSRISRAVLLTAGALLPTYLLAAASLTHVGAQPPSRDSRGVLAGQKFKNIKVLKNLPADRLIPVMHEYNTALGVQCTFCHVVREDHTGFESDEKGTKNAARAMITMVGDLNKHQKALNGQATCYMCHHGKPEPETRATGGEGGPERRGERERERGEREGKEGSRRER